MFNLFLDYIEYAMRKEVKANIFYNESEPDFCENLIIEVENAADFGRAIAIIARKNEKYFSNVKVKTDSLETMGLVTISQTFVYSLPKKSTNENCPLYLENREICVTYSFYEGE
jgi:hypothetical protein